MKKFCTAGTVGGVTFLVHGKDRNHVDADFFRMGADKPFFSHEFFSKDGALRWVNWQICKMTGNY